MASVINANAFLEVLRPVQEQLGLSTFVALLAIAGRPGISVNDLAEIAGVPQSTASRYVATLLGRYQTSPDVEPITFITQEISVADPRKRALYLSEIGRQVLSGIAGAFAENAENQE